MNKRWCGLTAAIGTLAAFLFDLANGQAPALCAFLARLLPHQRIQRIVFSMMQRMPPKRPLGVYLLAMKGEAA